MENIKTTREGQSEDSKPKQPFIFDFGGGSVEAVVRDEKGKKYLYPLDPKTERPFLMHRDGRIVKAGD